jgi:hypothetical protein
MFPPRQSLSAPFRFSFNFDFAFWIVPLLGRGCGSQGYGVRCGMRRMNQSFDWDCSSAASALLREEPDDEEEDEEEHDGGDEDDDGDEGYSE